MTILELLNIETIMGIGFFEIIMGIGFLGLAISFGIALFLEIDSIGNKIATTVAIFFFITTLVGMLGYAQ